MDLSIMQDKCDEVAGLLKQFAHPQRLLILCYLSDGEKQVSEIQNAVGLSQSHTSQFLKRMQNEGLLGLRREKNFSFYYIENPLVLKLLKAMQKIFCQ
ncbi:ArsR/SmtB family transcription factor [Peredibacter starrii]|uniref:Metalloregulator ArsR/SmtB family transcription factor n=1 Tax=Peredibacter starrii TaxID=28202 RepID=A0AAX4HTS8_9BACT|nr:metalloregulator ArsR/SmtB family transcription factor [Peredibacter starrii]WPU66784.1 metalloregulator ArsR/SmtB family transcription factor [Peredibacter starrii]